MSTGAGTRTASPATVQQLDAAVAAMPARLRAMVLLAAWCGLGFDELAGLQRHDVDVQAHNPRVWVRRPKNDPRSTQCVAVPAHLLPVLTKHLEEHTGADPSALLFPGPDGGLLPRTSLLRTWAKARAVAGRPDLQFRHVRRTGALHAAAAGAPLREVMARLGYATSSAALRRYIRTADALARPKSSDGEPPREPPR